MVNHKNNQADVLNMQADEMQSVETETIITVYSNLRLLVC